MNRLKKIKHKKQKRAELITATLQGYRHAVECYQPYSGTTNGIRTPVMTAYESGYDTGLKEFYSSRKK